jgi:hypothetical protein
LLARSSSLSDLSVAADRRTASRMSLTTSSSLYVTVFVTAATRAVSVWSRPHCSAGRCTIRKVSPVQNGTNSRT